MTCLFCFDSSFKSVKDATTATQRIEHFYVIHKIGRFAFKKVKILV